MHGMVICPSGAIFRESCSRGIIGEVTPLAIVFLPYPGSLTDKAYRNTNDLRSIEECLALISGSPSMASQNKFLHAKNSKVNDGPPDK